jgi:hypothetical protein
MGMATLLFSNKLKWLTRRSLAKTAIVATVVLLGTSALYLILLCHPGLFFRYSFAQGGMILYSDAPIPREPAGRVLSDAERRLARSPLFPSEPAKRFHIYICNQKWRFIFFANTRYRVGGLTYPPITNNIFLRAAHFEMNRLVSPSGQEVPGERTLSYYIAHEATHTLLADELGAARFWRLPSWKGEGYSDYVGKGGDFDYERAVDRLRCGAREMEPKRSGLYLRYHLLVAYLLDRRGLGIHELLDRIFDPAILEGEILREQPG